MARAGPVCSLATVPTRIYTPAPMVAPTPDLKEVKKKKKKTNLITC